MFLPSSWITALSAVVVINSVKHKVCQVGVTQDELPIGEFRLNECPLEKNTKLSVRLLPENPEQCEYLKEKPENEPPRSHVPLLLEESRKNKRLGQNGMMFSWRYAW